MAPTKLIRPLTPDDAAPAAALIRAAFAAIATRLDPAPSALRVTAETVRAHLATGGGAIAPEAGCVLWTLKAGGLYVGRLAVLPEHRRHGLALALLQAAEDAASSAGLPRIHAEIRLALAGNRRLFARAGYAETVQRAHPGYDHPTFTEAEKWLSPDVTASAPS